jgi:nucleotide-binding universal stress UspA family protein
MADTPILIAVDASERAGEVVRVGGELARSLGARVVLLRAIGIPGELPIEAYAMDPDGVVEVLRQRTTHELDDLARKLPEGVSREFCIEVGTAWEVIDRVARERHASLVVIGAHGYRPIDRVLGTTAARIVNHADRPVLVVRPIPDKTT